MSFLYNQTTGYLTHDDLFLGAGYSGYGEHANIAQDETVKGLGSIPEGMYTIGKPHVSEQTGPITMTLTPDMENEMFGRGSFELHGDNSALNHTASHGCIILPHDVRVKVAELVLTGDNRLRVISGENNA